MGRCGVQRLLFGITLGVVVLVVTLVSFSLFRGDGASAVGPEPTKIANDGSLGGVSDLLIGSVNIGAGSSYCIVKTDHQTSNNEVQIFLQCNTDFVGAPTGSTPPTWSDTCEALELANPGDCLEGSLNNPSETGGDFIAGPPPPPPYVILEPGKGSGFFYPGGTGSPGGVCGVTDCTVVTACFEDAGPVKGLGPNIISTAVIFDPKGGTTIMADTDGNTVKDTQVDRVSSGTVDLYYNQNNANCKALTPKGPPTFPAQPLDSIQVNDKGGSNVNPNPAPWRPSGLPGSSVLDFDGDGCTDEQELSPNDPGKCGDDPQNPSDSFSDPNTVDLSGIYDFEVRIVRGDCTDDQCTADAPGFYFRCRSDLQHNTGDDTVVLRPYCYTDTPGLSINPEAYPGIAGDGMAGAPPPGPDAGGGNFAYGDVDSTHTELSGIFNTETNDFEISGCFEDQDGISGLGNAYVELTVSAHQLPGTVDIWAFQLLADCQNGTPVGLPTYDDAELSMVQPNPAKSKLYDQDNDGVPTAIELNDSCLRDPFNKNDYYDVSIPRDGVIDLPNDVLGVMLHYAPGGYPAGDENWDRPPKMLGGAGHWNRGSPDGVIDLPNDILGVILQFNPAGTASGCGSAAGSPNLPPEAGGAMSLSVTAGEVSCSQEKDPSHVCVPAGESFTLTVEATAIPAGGYILAQSWIDYGSDLIFKSSLVTWPDCNASTIFGQVGANDVSTGCLTNFVTPLLASTYIGDLFEFDFNCSPGISVTEVKLLAVRTNPAGTSGAMYTEAGTDTQFLPVVHNVTVHCAGEAEPVETDSTATAPDGSGTLDTGTGDAVEVVLDVPVGGLPPSTNITVDVFLAEDVPEIVRDAVTLSRVFSFEPSGLTFDTPATAVITYLDSEVIGLDETTLDVLVYNHATDEWELADVVRDPDNNTLTFEMGNFSHRMALQRDGDQDGCPNAFELRDDEEEGGRRDPTIRWDYYDVLGPQASLPEDRYIDLANDILGVINHFAPLGTEPEYDVRFDRGRQTGADVWDMSAPDGVIDLANDILGVILQFGHDCQEP